MSLNLLKNVNLAEYTSWQIGGPADQFYMPTTIIQMQEVLSLAKKNQWPITILGGGTNVLISDQGIRGLTIGLRRFSEISYRIESSLKPEKLVIECLAGTAKSELLKHFLKHQLEPALFLAGLPGDVGGGVVMNAGVAENFTPREFMELVDWIDVMNIEGEIIRLKKADLSIRYRHTDGWQPHIIVRVGLSCINIKKPEILQQVRDANKLRLSKQPLDMPSCGSVFKNPDGYKAAQLIDQCGLKGYRIGDAQVSTKHANFIVNLGAAKAQDVWSLIQHVQSDVLMQTGVKLTTEVVRLGDW